MTRSTTPRTKRIHRPPAPRAGEGVTVWLTGLPSAGKSTIARALAHRLRTAGRDVHVLDGDLIRAELSPDLGFSRQDRDANVRRIGYVARLLASHGVIVVVAAIAPFADARQAVKAGHAADGVGYLEVFLDTPVEECRRRDVKGLYRKQAAGLISGLTGVDADYEAPTHPDLRLETHKHPLASCVEAIEALLSNHASS